MLDAPWGVRHTAHMKIAIIGGGAAGLMAAATIRENCPSAEVFLIDRNNGLGKKVIISGGGRCNVTTGILDVRTVLTKYPRGAKFLLKTMNRFPPKAVIAWFEANGVPLKTEEDLRVFPVSDIGSDVVGAFERLFADSNVQTILGHSVKQIEKTERGFRVSFTTQESLEADIVVLTTGGQAYRHTGSTGDGYAFAEHLGHSLTPLAASLNSFLTKETWPKELSGMSFEKVSISSPRSKTFSATGPFLFTHRGVSGPAVFALSSLVAFEHYDGSTPLELVLNIFPDEHKDSLQERIAGVIAKNPKKNLQTILGFVVPKRLAEILCLELKLDGTKHAIEFGKKDLQRIASWLTAIPLSAIGRGAGDEFVTAGGVPLTEVDPSTMESKICPGLYFGGEILDIDGFTGGFNLQSSWATGRLAGEAISARCE